MHASAIMLFGLSWLIIQEFFLFFFSSDKFNMVKDVIFMNIVNYQFLSYQYILIQILYIFYFIFQFYTVHFYDFLMNDFLYVIYYLRFFKYLQQHALITTREIFFVQL